MLKNQMCNKYLIENIDEFDFYEITFDLWVASHFFKKEQIPPLQAWHSGWS